MAEETLLLRMRALGARATSHDVDKVTKSVLGLNKASTNTRVSLGPFSTGFKGATLALGGFLLAVKSAVPYTLALAEGIGTAGAVAGGAGLVGLTAFGQATVVAKLGAGDLTKALGGNTAAYKKLTPEARRFYNTLYLAGAKLKGTSQRGLLPGLMGGAKSALGNLPTLNRVVGSTAKTLGGLGQSAGGVLGSQSFGKEFGAIGQSNTKIIANLGRAAIHAAVGIVHIVHAAGPLAVSLSRSALAGSKLFESWTKNKAASGEMAKFFREGKRDLLLISSATSHLTGGVLNLFGSSDVDGTKTLQNFDELTAKFDRWSQTMIGKPLGPELQKQLAIGLGQFASFIGSHIGTAGVTAAGAFWRAFWSADIWGKGITVAFLATKLGITKAVLGGIVGMLGGGKGKGAASGLTARGSSPANPLYVFVSNEFASSIAGRGGGSTVVGGAGKGKVGGGLLRRGVGFASKLALPVTAGIAADQALKQTALGRYSGSKGWGNLWHDVFGGGGGGGKRGDIVAANTAAFRGYRGIPTVASAMQDQRFGALQQIVIHLDVDGKTIATAVHRAGTKKKSTK